MMPNPIRSIGMISPAVAFLIVSFSLGELGDGLNIFQGIYLVNVGWNEGAVGIALSMMGLTALISQTFAGDWVSIFFDEAAGWFIVSYDEIKDNPGLFSPFSSLAHFVQLRWIRRASTGEFSCLPPVFLRHFQRAQFSLSREILSMG